MLSQFLSVLLLHTFIRTFSFLFLGVLVLLDFCSIPTSFSLMWSTLLEVILAHFENSQVLHCCNLLNLTADLCTQLLLDWAETLLAAFYTLACCAFNEYIPFMFRFSHACNGEWIRCSLASPFAFSCTDTNTLEVLRLSLLCVHLHVFWGSRGYLVTWFYYKCS